MRILYIEDSRTLREGIAHSLRGAGYVVTTAGDGNEGLSLAQLHHFDLVILDVMLPGIDGWTILNTLRKEGNKTGIIMLTARASIDDRIQGLDSGADDYLVKPFSIDELLARVRALIRRQHDKASNLIRVGSLKIDIPGRRVFWSEQVVELRSREFDILEMLALRAGKVVSRATLLDHVYDHAVDLKSNAIDSAVCNIRKSLASAGGTNLIKTVSRHGYLLDVGSI